MTIKDPADVCEALAPLGQEERLRALRRWLFGEGAEEERERERERLRQKWPSAARLTAAWEMSADLDSLRELLEGKPVDVARLKPDGYRRARQSRLVALTRSADYFDIREAA